MEQLARRLEKLAQIHHRLHVRVLLLLI